MATYSTGFWVATTWKPGAAWTVPMWGTLTRRSSRAGRSTFCTDSGMRLSSLMKSTAPERIASTRGPGKNEASPKPDCRTSGGSNQPLSLDSE